MKNAIISKAKWYIRCCSLVYLSVSFSSVVYSAEDVSKMNGVAIAQQAKTRTVVGSVIDFETGEPIIGASGGGQPGKVWVLSVTWMGIFLSG